MMNKNFIDVEYEIRKYFLIYLLIAYGIFLSFSVFKDINLFDYYMKTVDAHFYTLNKELGAEYENQLSSSNATSKEIYSATENYYEIRDYINLNQHILKYYFPGIAMIAIILIAFIHVTLMDVYIRRKNKRVLKAVKLNKMYPIVALILMLSVALLDQNGNLFLIKSMENVNMILGFILISFGIFVAASLINTIGSKTKGILTIVNIICIIVFPKIFWFLGVWGSLFNVKIIKKTGKRGV